MTDHAPAPTRRKPRDPAAPPRSGLGVSRVGNASRRHRAASRLLAPLLLFGLLACEDRGDLLGVELVVFTLGEWAGVGPQGEELRFILERDGDDVRVAAFLVYLPALADGATGEDEACATLVDAFTRFGNSEANVRVGSGSFRFRTPNDVRVDQDGLIESTFTGMFDAPDSATVDAEIVIDATRVLPCRIETSASWDVAPVES